MSFKIVSDEFDSLDATEKAAIRATLIGWRVLAAKIANKLRNKLVSTERPHRNLTVQRIEAKWPVCFHDFSMKNSQPPGSFSEQHQCVAEVPRANLQHPKIKSGSSASRRSTVAAGR